MELQFYITKLIVYLFIQLTYTNHDAMPTRQISYCNKW